MLDIYKNTPDGLKTLDNPTNGCWIKATDPNLDETQDLQFPKTQNILAPPIVHDNSLIAMDRYGHTEAFDIRYP